MAAGGIPSLAPLGSEYCQALAEGLHSQLASTEAQENHCGAPAAALKEMHGDEWFLERCVAFPEHEDDKDCETSNNRCNDRG